MEVTKIATLLIAGTLAISFALLAIARTAADKRERVALSDSSMSGENAQRSARDASSADEDNIKVEQEPPSQSSAEAPDGGLSEESARQ